MVVQDRKCWRVWNYWRRCHLPHFAYTTCYTYTNHVLELIGGKWHNISCFTALWMALLSSKWKSTFCNVTPLFCFFKRACQACKNSSPIQNAAFASHDGCKKECWSRCYVSIWLFSIIICKATLYLSTRQTLSCDWTTEKYAQEQKLCTCCIWICMNNFSWWGVWFIWGIALKVTKIIWFIA